MRELRSYFSKKEKNNERKLKKFNKLGLTKKRRAGGKKQKKDNKLLEEKKEQEVDKAFYPFFFVLCDSQKISW